MLSAFLCSFGEHRHEAQSTDCYSSYALLPQNGRRFLNFISVSVKSAVSFSNVWFHGWLWPTPVLQLSRVHQPGCLSLCRSQGGGGRWAVRLKGCRVLIYVFWQKCRQLIPGCRLKLQHALFVAAVCDLKWLDGQCHEFAIIQSVW